MSREHCENVTLRLPKRLKDRMREYDWINWSKVMRHLLEKKLDQLDYAATIGFDIEPKDDRL